LMDLPESADTVPSRRNRTHNNRPASVEVPRHSRRIHKRSGRHRSAWFPVLRSCSAGM
jgi:hypothetical protein